MTARIFRPAKTPTQSGTAKTRRWALEFESNDPHQIEPLMGWTSQVDMLGEQVKLSFETKEEAIAYAERNGVAYRVEEPKETKRRVMNYADNFKFNRAGPWTH